MFERFTERARQVVVLAQEEARRLRHNYIGTEHLLLGLLREHEGPAARVLTSLGVTLDEVRGRVGHVVGPGDDPSSAQIPFTPRAKRVLELSLREALSLGHSYIGTEHLLLGLVREHEGMAARLLLEFDADADKVRDAVFKELGARPPAGYEVSMQVSGRELRRAETFGVLATAALPMVLGAVLFGAGLLIGWLIWA